MLKPHEIFSRMSPAVAARLFAFLMETEKPLYKATIETLARQRKMRPVFVERKPREERHAWLHENLGRKASEGAAAHLLQIWLVGAHRKLLCDFLDALGIAHEENGTVETLPPAPSRTALTAAVEFLFAGHDPEIVAIYLHTFQALDETGWPTLEELLGEDPRLKLPPFAPTTDQPAGRAADGSPAQLTTPRSGHE